jgi:hypothetical protein
LIAVALSFISTDPSFAHSFIHHLSVVTTPMTNSQISPWELLPSGFFAIVYLMIVPRALPVLSFMVIVVSLYLILLHSGYEIFPRGTAEHWLGKWTSRKLLPIARPRRLRRADERNTHRVTVY